MKVLSPLHESTVVVLDSSVISKMPICDFLFRCAEKRLYRLQLTEDILADRKREVIHQGIPEAKAIHFENEVREAFPLALVTRYQALIPSMLIQKKHQHVLAAALTCNANVIATYYPEDFSLDVQDQLGVEVLEPDQLSLRLYEERPHKVMQVIKDQAGALQRPSFTLTQLLDNLEPHAPEFVRLIRNELINFEK